MVKSPRVGLPTLTRLARPSPSCARLPHRGVLSITGQHTNQFLDGLLSAKVPEPASRSHLYSVFLNAQGRLLYDVFLHSNANEAGEPGYLVEYDSRATSTPPLLNMLKRHVLRSKVKLRDVSEEYNVWAMWDPSPGQQTETREWNFASTGVVEPVWDPETEPTPWGVQGKPIQDRRAVGFGGRTLAHKGDKPHEASSYDEVPSEEYAVHRYMNCVPEGSEELVPTSALPVNSNMDIMGGLSFRKGCYVGQELIVRSMHVNTLRRRLFPVIIHRPNETPDEAHATSKPTFLANTDIACMFTQELPTASDRPVRPRGKSSLVSNLRGVGIAMLNVEQVEAWEKNECKFEIEHDQEKWIVSPSKPDWWPRPERG